MFGILFLSLCRSLFTGAAGVAEQLHTASTAFKVACLNYGLAP